ncbi:hypothetical protein K6V92_01970 [Cupriavidus respiraculi]|uniref:hypothetical protein n=1 Tax=Cupriavidus respiraculi TaxID=195930 RepID=UPI001C953376|nr:hypothetical protein [Cupriavidus respiraculi]MBY4945390.1 hypothetical protein [Cupriavidus respiraculi]
MAKRERNRRALQDEVSRRIHKIEDIAEDGARIRVPEPEPHPRDARGRNWDMKAFGNAAGYERAIRAVVDKVRDEFDLTEAPGAAGTPIDPFSDG